MSVAVLERLQQTYADLYDVHDTPPVAPFLCDAEEVSAAGGDPSRGEVLLVRDDGSDISVGLYVAPSALARLAGDSPLSETERFESWCLAAEGVSHFVYLLFRAQAGESVSQLELEVQAEVDKYAAALLETHELHPLAGYGVGLLQARSRALRRRLYAHQTLIDAPGTLEHDRYRLAMETADRYTGWLEREFVRKGDRSGLLAELRRFYRSSPSEKLTRA